ncbi:hypothetical protein CEXT_491741 [Caerostris extrusa]|uniref:Uncharacterized protein n=1 Tax=Caerostris extrusa TaxID=172846 RepID=A0AAV4PYN9_CAEEX|nr:hypothetical protein CEXT_491741 [Caerostris extrusa]
MRMRGENEDCSFQDGAKICSCQTGYVKDDGICRISSSSIAISRSPKHILLKVRCLLGFVKIKPYDNPSVWAEASQC